MRTPKIVVYRLEGASSGVKNIPWDTLQNGQTRIDLKKVATPEDIAKAESDYVVLIAGLDDEKTLKAFGTLDDTKIDVGILVVPPDLSKDAERVKIGRLFNSVYREPAHPAEMLNILELTILFLYYHFRSIEIEREESDWLRKIENIFEFSRIELIEKDKEVSAFQNLVDFENKLLEEQRKISEALIALQEFRDKERQDWEEEKKARENIEGMLSSELKDSRSTLKAQENLLEYNRQERIAYDTLLKKFQEKGTLTPDEIKTLFSEHKLLLQELGKVTQ